MRVLGLALLLMALPAPSVAQEWQVRAQLAGLRLTMLGESAGGFGFGVSRQVAAHLAIDFDVQRFPENPSGNFGHTLVLAGGRAGLAGNRAGAFVHARAGLLRLAGHHFEAFNEGARSMPAFDVGGTLELYRRALVFRLDVGDTILPFGATEIHHANGSSRPGTAHAYHVAIGVGVRFGGS